jgi:hypothetical protein
MPGEYLEIDNVHFLLYPFHFNIHPTRAMSKLRQECWCWYYSGLEKAEPWPDQWEREELECGRWSKRASERREDSHCYSFNKHAVLSTLVYRVEPYVTEKVCMNLKFLKATFRHNSYHNQQITCPHSTEDSHPYAREKTALVNSLPFVSMTLSRVLSRHSI